MLLCAVLMTSALAANAQTPPAPTGQPHAAKFEEHKQHELARITNHLQVLQTLQSCVQSATDHAALKACNQTAHAAMKSK